MDRNNRFTAIDLFAGAGGLTEGFIMGGINFVAHIEKDRDCCETLRTRLFYHFLRENGEEDFYYKYFRQEISREEFTSRFSSEFEQTGRKVLNIEIGRETKDFIFDQIDKFMKESGIKEIDLITGGPPCQSYSLVGRARNEWKEDDPRNYLYIYYAEFLKKYKPRIFVFENVPGILNVKNREFFQNIKKCFQDAGYEMEYSILNSADFMVLQNRKRVILIGWRKECGYNYPKFKPAKHEYRVKDILQDLPPLKAGQGEDRIPVEYAADASAYLRETGIRKEKDMVVHHRARRLNSVDYERYRIAIEKYMEAKRIKYTEFPEHLQTQKNKKSFLDRFKVVDWNSCCSHTVVAHLSKDGHYYIHPDINQIRSITVREAARLQSFPDNYLFEGAISSQFRQVGNAVPPLMARTIALKIKELLGK